MPEKAKQPDLQSAGDKPEDSLLSPELPEEPFPCPTCGQMLGPSVRVCVACDQPIDPRQIRRPQAPAATPKLQAPLLAAGRAKFSWQIFFIVLVIWLLAVKDAQMLWGTVKTQLAMGIVQIISSAWVFFDAQEKSVAKPLRWALGSLFLWIVIFPWYLARRKTPQASCPFVETEPGPLARALFFFLMVFFLLGAIVLILKGPPPR